MEEQETLFARNAHRMDRESRATLAYIVTKLGLKVMVSNSFNKRDPPLIKTCDGVKMSHFSPAQSEVMFRQSQNLGLIDLLND